MRYEGQKASEKGYAMGTGWLVAPDILVTAGHNVFDWSGFGRGLGRAVEIRCFIGYHGRKHIDSPIVQSRMAKNVVTTAEWVTARGNRHRDVAVIQVDRPFEGDLRLFTYSNTPSQDNAMLGVVGYPGDKFIVDDEDREEKGAEMYEMFSSQIYDLKGPENPLDMLEYYISTFGGKY